jgi:cell division protease FtsH
MFEFEQAKDKVMMGAERRSMVMTEEEKRLTAYHEGGHAIVAYYTPGSDPIHKATIIPRGRALGMVMRLPEGDRISMSRSKLLGDLKVSMGGRIAEELIFGHDKVTTGASSDIQMATEIARRMVTEWGLSDRLGFQMYGERQQEVFLGHSVSQHKPISEATAQMVDEEIRKILDTCYVETEGMLKKHIKKLHLLAKALLDYETLSGDEIKALLEDGTIPSHDAISGHTAKKKTRTTIPDSGGKKQGAKNQTLSTISYPEMRNPSKET